MDLAVGIAVGRESEEGFGVGLPGRNVGSAVGDKFEEVHTASELCRNGKDDLVRQEGRQLRPGLLSRRRKEARD